MTISVAALYENGILRLEHPLALPNGWPVRVLVTAGSAPLPLQKPAAVLAEIAALPLEPGDQVFSNRDHDRILYGV